MLAQLQMQAHEQGYNAGLNEGDRKATSRVIRKVWRKG
jgi:flagellar biosynthesis/type III secretory pathway protein FliH